MKNNEARIDKWLWAARIFKTRTIAAAACKKGQVSMKGAQLKPSRTIRVGDVIDVRKPPITYSFRVLQTIEKRVGAKLVPEVMENVTAPEQYELLEMAKISGFIGRAKGLGRPTKKDRRSLDEFTSDMPEFFGDFDFVRILGQREGKPIKPDPAIVHEAMEGVPGIGLDEVVYCGDSDVDMLFAKNAGAKGAGCLWGFRDEAELKAAGADYLARVPLGILECL